MSAHEWAVAHAHVVADSLVCIAAEDSVVECGAVSLGYRVYGADEVWAVSGTVGEFGRV